MKFANVGCRGGRKTGVLGENPSEPACVSQNSRELFGPENISGRFSGVFLGSRKVFLAIPESVPNCLPIFFGNLFVLPATIMRLELERLFLNAALLLQLLIFQAENCNCKINLHVNAVLKNRFQHRYY